LCTEEQRLARRKELPDEMVPRRGGVAMLSRNGEEWRPNMHALVPSGKWREKQM
jgi:hypothetical protein